MVDLYSLTPTNPRQCPRCKSFAVFESTPKNGTQKFYCVSCDPKHRKPIHAKDLAGRKEGT